PGGARWLLPAGAACAVLAAFAAPGPFFALAFPAYLLLKARQRHLFEGRRALLVTLVAAAVLRLSLVLVYQAAVYWSRLSVDFFGDARGYTHVGLYIASLLRGEMVNAGEDAFASWFVAHEAPGLREGGYWTDAGGFPSLLGYHVSAYSYAMGWLFAIFGFSPLMIKLLNSMLSVWTGVVVYLLARDLWGERAGVAAARFFLFFPSVVFWSITGLKDTVIIAGLVTCVWCATRYLRDGGAGYLVLGAGLTGAAWTIRTALVGPLVLALLMAVATRMARALGGVAPRIFLTAGMIVLGGWLAMSYPSIISFSKSVSEGWVHGEGTVYRIFPARFYLEENQASPSLTAGELLGVLLIATAYGVFSPFPWEITTNLQRIALPQVLVWYGLFPFFIIGLRQGLRQSRALLPMLVLGVGLVGIIALGSGNVGSAFRHRDMLTPFYLVLASGGLCHILGWPKADGVG
ncbi:MAG: glycosyltransferase family 39 protein, partial [Deltaproteobacteria bacterium]|nr:glycosyltransferase family 39 protein [Deltaproteobacteria bacterium]